MITFCALVYAVILHCSNCVSVYFSLLSWYQLCCLSAVCFCWVLQMMFWISDGGTNYCCLL